MNARPDILALATLLACPAPTARAAEYYVATNGNDGWDGLSVTTAFQSIQRAADRTAPGDTVWIGGGEYREMVTATNYGAPGQRITFAALGDAAPVIMGSDLVTGWAPLTNAVWVRPGWEPEPQQLFADGTSLQKIGVLPKMWPGSYTPVGSNLSDMTAGSFFYDTNTSDLYVWLPGHSSPTSSVMEASTRVFCFYTPATNEHSWLHLKGLKFRHSNTVTVTNGWPAVLTGGNSIIEDCDVQWADFAGISLGPHAKAIRCIASNNGNSGIGALEDFLIDSCSVLSNNVRNFNPDWHAGGIKIIPDAWGTVQNCEIGWNRGQGLWFDYCTTGEPIVARYNYIHDNAGAGLMIEVTKNVTAHNNLIARHSPRSVYFSSCESNAVFNNTIIDNADWVTVEMTYVPTRTNEFGAPLPLRNNDFRNNIVYGSKGICDLAVMAPDSVFNTNNTVDHNCYYATNHAWHARMILNPAGAAGTAYTNLAEWRAATGLDLHSLSDDPRFLDAANDDFHLRSEAGTWSNGTWHACADTSPAIDAGDPTYASTNETAFNGRVINLGRYGNTPEASRSPDLDGDGLSDPLETRVTASDPANPDTDGDHWSDGDEWLAGTDILSRASFFRILPVPGPGGAVSLSFFAAQGKQYLVEFSTDLRHWEALDSTPISGVGDHVTIPDPSAPSSPSRFYRARLVW